MRRTLTWTLAAATCGLSGEDVKMIIKYPRAALTAGGTTQGGALEHF